MAVEMKVCDNCKLVYEIGRKHECERKPDVSTLSKLKKTRREFAHVLFRVVGMREIVKKKKD